MGLEKTKLALNVTTGEFDLITVDNHSYEEIEANKTGKVRKGQQMIVHEEFLLEGTLILDGTLILEL